MEERTGGSMPVPVSMYVNCVSATSDARLFLLLCSGMIFMTNDYLGRESERTMARIAVLALLLLLGSVHVSAQDIAISGTVTDENGNPVANAVVTTTAYRYSDYADQVYAESDTAGYFSLVAHVVAIGREKKFVQPVCTPLSIKNNALNFTSYGPIAGMLAITSFNGKLVQSIPFDFAVAGSHVVALPDLKTVGFYLLRLSVNGRVYTGTLLCCGGWNYSPGKLRYRRGAGNVSGVEAGGIGDTLVVTKNGFIVTSIPLDSYTKEGMDIALSGGVLRSLFLASATMIPGWKPGYSTPDSSFTLWNASDIFQDINGGGEKYVQNGMLQMADLNMIGPDNADGSSRKLTPQASFIMDFGNGTSAEGMFLMQRDLFYDDDALTVEGYDDSTVFATVNLVGATVFSYKKQFYFELSFSGFPEASDAVAAGKEFLEYFFSKIE